MRTVSQGLGHFFFQAEDGIRDSYGDWSSDVCSSDLDDELPRRVDVDEVAVLEATRVVELPRQDRVQDVLDQIRLDQRVRVEPLAVLGRDQHALEDRKSVV